MIPGSAAVGTITVRYFAGAAEAAGCEEERLDIADLGPADLGPAGPAPAALTVGDPAALTVGAPAGLPLGAPAGLPLCAPAQAVLGSGAPAQAVPGSGVPALAVLASGAPGPTEADTALIVADLRAALVAAHGAAFERVLGRCSVLVGGVRAGDADPVPPGAVVDVLPPFAGG